MITCRETPTAVLTRARPRVTLMAMRLGRALQSKRGDRIKSRLARVLPYTCMSPSGVSAPGEVNATLACDPASLSICALSFRPVMVCTTASGNAAPGRVSSTVPEMSVTEAFWPTSLSNKNQRKPNTAPTTSATNTANEEKRTVQATGSVF